MQMLDAAHFTRKKPSKVADFMNFLNEPPAEQNTEEYYAQLDRDVFGL